MYPFLVAIFFGVILAFTTVSTGQMQLYDMLTNRSDEVTVDFYAYKKAVNGFLCTSSREGVIPDEELEAQLGKTIAGTEWHHYISGGTVYFYITDSEKNRHLSAGLTDRIDVMQAVVLDGERKATLLNGQHTDITVPEAVPAGSIVLPMDISHICVLETDVNDQATLSDGTVIDLCAQKVTTASGAVVSHYNETLGVDGVTVETSRELTDGMRVTVNGYVFTVGHSIRMQTDGMTVDGIHYDWSSRQSCGGTPSTPETYDSVSVEAPEGGNTDINDPNYDPNAGDNAGEDPDDTAETSTSVTELFTDTHTADVTYVWGTYGSSGDVYMATADRNDLLGSALTDSSVTGFEVTVTVQLPASYQFLIVGDESGYETIYIVETCGNTLTLNSRDLSSDTVQLQANICGMYEEGSERFFELMQDIGSPLGTANVTVRGTYTHGGDGEDDGPDIYP